MIVGRPGRALDRKFILSGTRPVFILFSGINVRRSALITSNVRFKGEVPMKLMEGFDSNYRYILVAARRARQLQSGAPPVVDTNSRKPCRIAQDEIRAGKVKWEIPDTRTAAQQASENMDKALGQD
jgi:DNA-directed RNA polymerase subunit omega